MAVFGRDLETRSSSGHITCISFRKGKQFCFHGERHLHISSTRPRWIDAFTRFRCAFPARQRESESTTNARTLLSLDSDYHFFLSCLPSGRTTAKNELGTSVDRKGAPLSPPGGPRICNDSTQRLLYSILSIQAPSGLHAMSATLMGCCGSITATTSRQSSTDRSACQA